MKKIVLLVAGMSDIESGATQIKGIGVYDSYHENIKEKIIKTFTYDMNGIFKSKSITRQLESTDINDLFERDGADYIELVDDKGYGISLAIYVVPLDKVQDIDYTTYGGQ